VLQGVDRCINVTAVFRDVQDVEHANVLAGVTDSFLIHRPERTSVQIDRPWTPVFLILADQLH
jgi:hypothetical protein